MIRLHAAQNVTVEYDNILFRENYEFTSSYTQTAHDGDMNGSIQIDPPVPEKWEVAILSWWPPRQTLLDVQGSKLTWPGVPGPPRYPSGHQ